MLDIFFVIAGMFAALAVASAWRRSRSCDSSDVDYFRFAAIESGLTSLLVLLSARGWYDSKYGVVAVFVLFSLPVALLAIRTYALGRARTKLFGRAVSGTHEERPIFIVAGRVPGLRGWWEPYLTLACGRQQGHLFAVGITGRIKSLGEIEKSDIEVSISDKNGLVGRVKVLIGDETVEFGGMASELEWLEQNWTPEQAT